MKNKYFFIISILCIISVLFAGCVSNANAGNAGTTSIPTQPQQKYNSGDVIAKDFSVTAAVAVADFDSTLDSYQIFDVAKNSDGTWQALTNPSQRTLSRTAAEKIYPKKIGSSGKVSSQYTSSSSQNSVQSSYTTQRTSSPSQSSVVQIRITYSGSWSGSYGDAGATQSIDGTGSKTITLTDPTYNIVSTAFQKKDGSQDEMKVEILKDGTVLNSRSTTAAYGVVAVATTLNGGTSSSINPVSSKTVQIKLYYDGQWSGAYGEAGALQSVDGSGAQTYTITNPNYIVSASFQKKDGSASELRVEISEEGTLLKSGSTTAAYGLVLVSATV